MWRGEGAAFFARRRYDERMPSAEAIIERVRKIALGFPDAYEKLSHGEPTFFNKAGVFVMIDNHHHGSKHLSIWCNAPSGAQESLSRATRNTSSSRRMSARAAGSGFISTPACRGR